MGLTYKSSGICVSLAWVKRSMILDALSFEVFKATAGSIFALVVYFHTILQRAVLLYVQSAVRLYFAPGNSHTRISGFLEVARPHVAGPNSFSRSGYTSGQRPGCVFPRRAQRHPSKLHLVVGRAKPLLNRFSFASVKSTHEASNAVV